MKASSTAFLGHEHAAGSEVEQQELELVPIWNASITESSLIYYTTTLAPQLKAYTKMNSSVLSVSHELLEVPLNYPHFTGVLK